MTKIGDYNKIMSDRNLFNQVVYTPVSEALKLLEERRNNPELIAKIEKLLKGDIPDFFLKNGKCAILGRHIATPNHENRMFLALAKEYKLYPVFFEYHEDKFTSNNTYKHSLGQLQIQTNGKNKSGDSHFEKITIVDFNIYNGKKLKDVLTIWGEKLTDYHKKLFSVHNYNTEDIHFYDASNWFKKNGGQKATNFYVNFLTLFVCNGILFENFLTSDDEDGDFTKNVVLPAIEEVINLTGVRPLIVPIGPLDIETENFWFHHLSKVKKTIKKYTND